MPRTPLQAKILRFIANYITQQRFSPTLAEIAAEFNCRKETIWEHVRGLETQGFVSVQKFKARSIRLRFGVYMPDLADQGFLPRKD